LRSRVGARDDGFTLAETDSHAPAGLRMTCIRGAKQGAYYLFGWVRVAFLWVRCNLNLGAFWSKWVANRLQNREKTCKKYAKNTQNDVFLRVFCTCIYHIL